MTEERLVHVVPGDHVAVLFDLCCHTNSFGLVFFPWTLPCRYLPVVTDT
jgi:hypothetical protein